MAKTGLNYYTIDTDRYQDIRIKRLKKDFGCSGLAVYDYILCEIYRVRGCFLEWDENTAFDVAEYLGLKESLVTEIVKYSGAVGLFEKGLLSRGILTSASIQKRYLDMCKRAKRSDAVIPSIAEIREETPIIPEKTANTTEEAPKVQEEIDKVNKSKVNKEKPLTGQKEVAVATAPAAPNVGNKTPVKSKPDPEAIRERQEKKRQDFYNMLIPYVATYGKEMVRDFFDYWTEPNKSGTQWRFELERTWDTARRLRTWAQRNKQFNHAKPQDNSTSVCPSRQRAADAAAIIARLAAEDDARE